MLLAWYMCTAWKSSERVPTAPNNKHKNEICTEECVCVVSGGGG